MNSRGVFNTTTPRSEYKTSYAYNKKQASVLSTSMLTASIGFIAVFLIGFLSEYLLKLAADNGNAMGIQAMSIVSTIGLLVGLILSIVWSFRLYKASTAFGITVISIYCISYGIGFGFLFYALNMLEIISAFGMVGLIFLGTYLIAKAMSIKVAMKLGKFIFIASMVYMVSFFVLLMVLLFVPLSWTANVTIILITTGVSGLLSVLYLTWSLWMAQNMDNFISEEQLSKKMGLFIGFQILMNLVQLVFLILRLFAIFGRR